MFVRSFRVHFMAVCIAASSAVLAHGQALDQLYTTKGGVPNKGTVTDATTKDAVTLDMAGVARQFPISEVARIVFGDEPQQLSNARNSVIAKNYDAALESLKQIPAGSLVRPQILQDAQFYMALCQGKIAMTEGGDRAKAEADLSAFARAYPNSFHFYEAAELLGDMAMSNGRYDLAVRYFTPLSKAAAEDVQMRANNNMARALVGQKKFAEAITAYDAVLGGTLVTQEAQNQKLLATVGRAGCLGETGKPEDGIKILDEIIAKNDPEDARLFSRTYNALGTCQMKAGRNKEALLAFLHTDVMYSGESEAHAEALYNLVKVWTALNKGERAAQARATLKDRFAGSIWATKE
ncbi:tetratricopeptide repeat protein [Anatilimnocola floriformis]|uniref:tetratricopeptide repeat protein n=1 Tax=Anatilimnocola floriformis TaxID=2948575 RepID=UPI0020C3C7D3|nr:tetratricopeptide repeat protein [Anatilimnocola floriformis]